MRKVIPEFLKRRFIRNYRRHCPRKIGHALLYYKTEPFNNPFAARNYAHTNNWEIVEIVRIFNKLGYWVDIIDRSIDIKRLRLEDKYDIFIGIGAGNSGKYYPFIAAQVPRAIKIFYAAGSEPKEKSNVLIQERYKYFYQRNPGKQVALRRIIDKVDIDAAMALTDAIFCIGGAFTLATYQKFKKPIYKIYPSTSPRITFDFSCVAGRSQKKFLYFGGNGNIVKGLDLVIEAFAGLPDYELYICAPKTEDDFNAAYKELLARSPNIHFVGFVKVGGKVFDSLTARCSYLIFPSCSEGIATSVATCMRKGLIPLTTRETDIELGDFGYLIDDISIEGLRKQIKEVSLLPRAEFVRRSIATYVASSDYTQGHFSYNFERILVNFMIAKGKIPGNAV